MPSTPSIRLRKSKMIQSPSTDDINNATAVVVSLFPALVSAPITPVAMIGWCFFVSLLGGVAASLRKGTVDLFDVLKVGLNTGVMGGCLAMVATPWVRDNESFRWMIIGTCGILSLGGMATIDWVLDRFRQRIDRELKSDNSRSPD